MKFIRFCLCYDMVRYDMRPIGPDLSLNIISRAIPLLTADRRIKYEIRVYICTLEFEPPRGSKAI